MSCSPQLLPGYRLAIRVACVIASCAGVFATTAEAVDNAEFERDVAPVIAKRCLECHNPRDVTGGLDLSTEAGLREGGDSGAVIDSAGAEASLLWQHVSTGQMPPESRGQSQQIPAHETALLKKWIDAGAPWPRSRVLDIYEQTTDVRAGRDWWSLQPVQRPDVPTIAGDPGITEIDALVLEKLRHKGLTPAPAANRRDLIKRATYDLTGLPPSPEAIAAFSVDTSQDAYPRLIDRLLESPAYGEHWARHWLDLVRFAETCGYERDQLKPNIWRYRDWVITALNDDMPYTQFVTEQLAGDEIPDRTESSVIATGMIRAGTWNDEPNDPADYVYERLEDMVHTTTTSFLGLTVKCARCHDHKFDPIPQRDYYRIASFFWAGYIGQGNLGGPNAEQLGVDVFGWTDKSREVPPIHLLVKGQRGHSGPVVEPGFLSAVESLGQQLSPPPPEARTTQRRLQFADWITQRDNPLTARAIVNRLWQHHLGQGLVNTPNNFGFKGEMPTHPKLLDWLAAEFMDNGWRLKPLHRRIMLSRTYRQSVEHPDYAALAERDFANHYLWRASRRRLSAESLRDAMLATSGELNRKLGGPSFYPKMSAEALEGLSRKAGAWDTSSKADQGRRSIYMMTKRSRILPLMTAFDFCDTTRPCGKRDSTTVAPQALAMLNNDFVHQQSQAMAVRVEREVGQVRLAQVQRAFQLALGRIPTENEFRSSMEYLAQQEAHFAQGTAQIPASKLGSPDNAEPQTADLALASLCHVLLNTNEFMYIE